MNDRQVFRPYTDEIKLSVNCSDYIQQIEFFQFKSVDSEFIALGWYAKVQFLATLPTALNVKGIRVRQGNIEVGGEHFLEDKFSEPRFSGWQIGEIHVVNNALKPNARQDGFEHTANFERFLEQSHALGRYLSSLCRKSSNTRIASARMQGSLEQLEKLLDNPMTYIDDEHYRKAVDDAQVILQNMEHISTKGISEDMSKRLDLIKERMGVGIHKPVLLEHVLDKRKLRRIDQKTLLKHVANTIITNFNTSKSAEDMLQQVFADFTKPTYTNYKIQSHVSGK